MPSHTPTHNTQMYQEIAYTLFPPAITQTLYKKAGDLSLLPVVYFLLSRLLFLIETHGFAGSCQHIIFFLTSYYQLVEFFLTRSGRYQVSGNYILLQT